MKKIFFALVFFFCMVSFAQKTEVNYKDLGFTKKIKKVESYTYSFEDKWVTDKSSDVYEFDEKGNIINHAYFVYGKYASETFEN